MKCKKCQANLDLTLGSCPSCGAAVELGRLTGILGMVCRSCDAYNEPGAKTCVACGKSLRGDAPEAAPAPPSVKAPAPPPPPSVPAERAPDPDPAAPGAPVVRAFQKPSAGNATRFVPAVLRPSAEGKPAAPPPPAPPQAPGVRAIPLAPSCPRCGAPAGQGRFCAQCGQALGARGTQIMMQPAAVARAGSPSLEPVAPGQVKLVLESGDASGAEYPLDAEAVEAGRTQGGIRFPDDPCLAPHHATFFFRGGALHVRDEGAPGGLYLRLRGLSVPLRPGDHFAVGERLLRFAGLLPPPPPAPPDGTRRLGAPRPAPPALVVEEWLEGGLGGRAFVRSGPAVTIGRAGCAVSLGDDPHLSQLHAEIVLEHDGGARLRDLGSSNGTYVRVPPHAERELRDGDYVRMGHAVLRVAVG